MSTVEERATKAADEVLRASFQVGYTADYSLRIAEAWLDGYRKAAASEGPRRAIEELEALVPLMCRDCRVGSEMLQRPSGRRSHLFEGDETSPCSAQELHAAIARLRKEIE